MLPVPAVHGDVAGGALMLAIVMALVVSGWLSAWSTVFVLVAPVLGEVSDLLGLASPGGDITAFATGLFIVAPISAALIGLGVGLLVVRRRFRATRRASVSPRDWPAPRETRCAREIRT